MSKLKLTEIQKSELGRMAMNQLKGGRCCGCGCHGSSSTEANYRANYYGGDDGLTSLGGSSVCTNGSEVTSHC